jgi:two-component system, NarL family, invasion response regulator UvrY
VRISVPKHPDADPSAASRGSTVAVLIVDDQAPFRSAARSLVELVDGWRVIGEVGSGEAAIQTAGVTRPDLV